MKIQHDKKYGKYDHAWDTDLFCKITGDFFSTLKIWATAEYNSLFNFS